MVAIALALLLLLGLPGAAHAYVDPSSGSVLLQLLLGGFAGVMVALRLSWRRVAALFGRRQGDGTAEERDSIR